MTKDKALAVWLFCHMVRATGGAIEEFGDQVRAAQTKAAGVLKEHGINLPIPRKCQSMNSVFDELMEGEE